MNQQNEVLDRLIGGFYSVGEVRRLSGISENVSRRFVNSYKGIHGLWGGGIQKFSGGVYLTFRALMEIRHIASFNSAGVSWQRIIRAASRAKLIFASDYPFSDLRFKTDGAHIFRDSGTELEQVSQYGQMAFKDVLGGSLFDPVDYWENQPVCWYPAEEWGLSDVGKTIMINPNVAFGAPVIVGYHIPAEVIYQSYKAEHDDAYSVAANYEIPQASVECAIIFQEKMLARDADQ